MTLDEQTKQKIEWNITPMKTINMKNNLNDNNVISDEMKYKTDNITKFFIINPNGTSLQNDAIQLQEFNNIMSK